MFSSRSATENPRSEQIPALSSSPSSVTVLLPFALSDAHNARAIVDFPAPDNPVSQRTGGIALHSCELFGFTCRFVVDMTLALYPHVAGIVSRRDAVRISLRHPNRHGRSTPRFAVLNEETIGPARSNGLSDYRESAVFSGFAGVIESISETVTGPRKKCGDVDLMPCFDLACCSSTIRRCRNISCRHDNC